MSVFTREAAKEFANRIGTSEPAAPAYLIEQRGPDCFAVLGPNPDAGKRGVSYSGEHLTVCTTDGRDDAVMIAKALNLFGALQTVAA